MPLHNAEVQIHDSGESKEGPILPLVFGRCKPRPLPIKKRSVTTRANQSAWLKREDDPQL